MQPLPALPLLGRQQRRHRAAQGATQGRKDSGSRGTQPACTN